MGPWRNPDDCPHEPKYWKWVDDPEIREYGGYWTCEACGMTDLEENGT